MSSQHSEISKQSLLDIIQTQRFGVEYQPIIDLKTGQAVAYEALSRFYDLNGSSVRPDWVYAALHDSPITLFQVEYAHKCLQLQYKPTGKLFVNLDQDAFFATDVEASANPFVKLVRDYGQDQVVVELIENSELNDAIKSLSMIEAFDQLQIETALDDLCNPLSMISVSVLQLVGWVKLDRCVLRMQNKPVFMTFVRQMIQFARATGKQIVLEGIESEQDLEVAKALNVDFVQGFLYRSEFINILP